MNVNCNLQHFLNCPLDEGLPMPYRFIAVLFDHTSSHWPRCWLVWVGVCGGGRGVQDQFRCRSPLALVAAGNGTQCAKPLRPHSWHYLMRNTPVDFLTKIGDMGIVYGYYSLFPVMWNYTERLSDLIGIFTRGMSLWHWAVTLLLYLTILW